MIMRMNHRMRLNWEYQLNLGPSYGLAYARGLGPYNLVESMLFSNIPQETYQTKLDRTGLVDESS
jgi:hypothetical protein